MIDCNYQCPFCGDDNALEVDEDLAGDVENLIQDCANCCRPAEIQVRIHKGTADVLSVQPA